MYLFTVIIPCYNVSAYLPYCLQSLEQQSIGIHNLQIILIDDASTDQGATTDLLLAFEQKYPENVLVICSEQNKRQGGARNLGLPYAEGEYLAFCDSDDYLHPDMLKICYELMDTHQLDQLEFDKHITENHELHFTSLTVPSETPFVREIHSVEDRKQFLRMNDSILTCWASVYRTSIILQNDVRYAENIFFEEPSFTFLYRFYVKRYCHIQEKLYYYFRHPGSTTSSRFSTKRMDAVVNNTILAYELRNRGFFQDYLDEISFQIWNSTFYHNMIYAAQTNTLFLQEELLMMQKLMTSLFPDIRQNPYFKEEYAPLPALGDLTYCNLQVIRPEQILEFYKTLWNLVK